MGVPRLNEVVGTAVRFGEKAAVDGGTEGMVNFGKVLKLLCGAGVHPGRDRGGNISSGDDCSAGCSKC